MKINNFFSSDFIFTTFLRLIFLFSGIYSFFLALLNAMLLEVVSTRSLPRRQTERRFTIVSFRLIINCGVIYGHVDINN